MLYLKSGLWQALAKAPRQQACAFRCGMLHDLQSPERGSCSLWQLNDSSLLYQRIFLPFWMSTSVKAPSSWHSVTDWGHAQNKDSCVWGREDDFFFLFFWRKSYAIPTLAADLQLAVFLRAVRLDIYVSGWWLFGSAQLAAKVLLSRTLTGIKLHYV